MVRTRPVGRVLLWGFNKAQGFLSVTTWENCGWFSREVSFSSYAKNRLSKLERCRLWLSFVSGLPRLPRRVASGKNPIGFTLPYGILRIKSKLATWSCWTKTFPTQRAQKGGRKGLEGRKAFALEKDVRPAGGEWKGKRAGRPRSDKGTFALGKGGWPYFPSRRALRRILPEWVLGSSGTNSTMRGYL